MEYSRAVRSRVLKKVLPPDARSIAEVTRETGNNDQTIQNWVKKSESGILPDDTQESMYTFSINNKSTKLLSS